MSACVVSRVKYSGKFSSAPYANARKWFMVEDSMKLDSHTSTLTHTHARLIAYLWLCVTYYFADNRMVLFLPDSFEFSRYISHKYSRSISQHACFDSTVR